MYQEAIISSYFINLRPNEIIVGKKIEIYILNANEISYTVYFSYHPITCIMSKLCLIRLQQALQQSIRKKWIWVAYVCCNCSFNNRKNKMKVK